MKLKNYDRNSSYDEDEEDRQEMMGVKFKNDADKKKFKKLQKEIRRKKMSFIEGDE